MIRLKKSTTLALYAAHDLGTDPARVLTAGEIAERYRASEHHVAKVLQRLARAGIVRSARGARGGFQLARDPRAITLFDVVAVFEPRAQEDTQVRRGADAHAPPPAGARRLENVLAEIDQQADSTLRSISIATLVAPRRMG
jgi:Rrf2 family protein